MNIICNRSNLFESIRTVQKAVSSKTALPILKGIFIEAYKVEDKGFLRLVGNDMNIGIESTLEADVIQEGSFVVASAMFGDIVSKLSSDAISINVENNSSIVITSDQTQFNIQIQPADEFPSLPDIDAENSLTIGASLLSKIIRQTRIAISQDESRPVLTGSLMEVENGIMTVVSIDGFRMALKKTALDTAITTKVVIPGKTLSELGKILQGKFEDKDVKISFAANHVVFEIENIRVISRLLEGEFIKYSQILPNDYKTKAIVNASELSDAIDRASVIIREGKGNSIKLIVSDKKIKIKSNCEYGSSDEEVKISLEGHDLEIGFNYRYLSEVFKVIDTEEIILEFTTPVSPCLVKPLGEDDYIYLVLPVRLSN